MKYQKRFLFLILLGICFQSCVKEKPERPNIILIMTDDQGWGDVGFNGNEEIITPNLDALASQGIVLNRFYSASAVCSPTRASLITGRNPLRMNIPYANSGFMKTEEVTIPELLKEEGYRTGHFGKWHLGTFTKTEFDANRGGRAQFDSAYTNPQDHGYDTFFATESKVPTFDPMSFPKSFINQESKRYGWRAIENEGLKQNYGTYYWSDGNHKVTENLEGPNAKLIMDRVIPFLQNSLKEDKPFFTTIWFHTPHLPVVSDSIHRSLYADLSLEKQLYYGSITAMDEQIGRLWKTLETEGIDDETLIFFCSDNGPERGTPGSAGPFRERKRSLYEGGVRVPAFVLWKNHFEGNNTIDFPMVTSDYLPTLLDLLNIDNPFTHTLDGTTVLPALNGEVKDRTKPIGFICRPYVSWVTDQHKLIGSDNLDNFELYDLLKDPSEQNNIILEEPTIAESLERDLREWLQAVEVSRNGGEY